MAKSELVIKGAGALCALGLPPSCEAMPRLCQLCRINQCTRIGFKPQTQNKITTLQAKMVQLLRLPLWRILV